MSGSNFIKGNTKRCNGPLHNGEYIPLTEFWYFKSGIREGKPFSQCINCQNFKKWGNTDHGLVVYQDVKFIFEELEFRLGKAETARRIGVSSSFFYRRNARIYKRIRKGTVVRAMVELKKCRDNREARHRKSIRHGAAARGHKERIPIKHGEFNGVNVKGKEYSHNFNKRRWAEAKLTG